MSKKSPTTLIRIYVKDLEIIRKKASKSGMSLIETLSQTINKGDKNVTSIECSK